MQKCQPRGSVNWTLISVMASSGVVKARKGEGKGEKLLASAEEARGRERKEVMQTFQPHFITALNVN